MSTAPTQHHLDVNGGRLHYEVRGSGPLLLVVGQPMTSGPFAPLADDLAADHTVVTYDPHGVGESSVDDPSASITPEIEADDLAAIVDRLGLGPAAMMGTSGGAVAGLAFACRYPDKISTLIAHEPPVTELLPDVIPVRAAVEAIEDTYRSSGSGPAWGAFASLVMHQGLVSPDGVPPAAWPPPDALDDDQRSTPADDQSSDAGPPPEPSAKQQADDELFFLRMLKPFTRYAPDVHALRDGPVRVRVAVGAASGREVARRSAEALADRLGQTPVVFPSHHAGFMEDPAGFAAAVREVLTAP
ncbi:MAG TPA: alpha/beta hydrolase [Microlunatus sp.]